MGGMMGGGSSSPTITMEKSVYGSDKWEQVKIISGIDSVYSVQWISGIEPGDYRFRFVSADSVVIDSVAGFKIKENAPDVHVYQDGKATNYVFYGLCKENVKKTFKVYNSGTGPVVVNVSSTDDKVFNVKNGTIDVPASDSLFVDVEFIRDAAAYGENNAILIFAPGSEVLQAKPVAVKAYKISDEAWSEDFETPYVVEDESVPRELPEGWESTGWKVTKPSGGMMEMFGGGGEPKSWMATTDSKAYELITPRLQAVQRPLGIDGSRFVHQSLEDINETAGTGHCVYIFSVQHLKSICYVFSPAHIHQALTDAVHPVCNYRVVQQAETGLKLLSRGFAHFYLLLFTDHACLCGQRDRTGNAQKAEHGEDNF